MYGKYGRVPLLKYGSATLLVMASYGTVPNTVVIRYAFVEIRASNHSV
jgi:hypothetical protein